jgi:hypothetical protein
MLSGLINLAKSEGQPSSILSMLSTLGLLPPSLELVYASLATAPKPQKTNLTADWISNVDVLAHAVGCVVASAYDNLVAGMTMEEVELLNSADISRLVPEGMARTFLLSSFEVCKEVSKEVGPLTTAIENNEIPAEGLVVKAVMTPFVKRRVNRTNDRVTGPKPSLAERLLGKPQRQATPTRSSPREV